MRASKMEYDIMEVDMAATLITPTKQCFLE
jgi:hypothetical protein